MIKNIFWTVLSVLMFQSAVFADIVKFVQVADSHYKSGNEYRADVLKETVKNINNETDISFVVFTGDNIDSPHAEYLPEFIKIINKLKVPYYIVIGNHDVYKNNGLSKARYYEIVRENNLLYRKATPNYTFKKKGFVFVVADGAKEIIPGTVGYYKEDTLNWINKQLTKNKKRKVIILQHFPLIATKEVTSHRVYNKDEYLEMLDKHDNVIAVVAGHLHTNGEKMRNGVYHITSPTLLSDPPVYKVITVSTTKGFSPMVYTELKQIEMPKK